MNMAKKEWKRGLLSSGFPLEFETAKILVRNRFAFDPDYHYERIDAGQTKDFSVDLKGTLYFPTSNPKIVTADLILLIECKYRTTNKTWVFLPDVSRPDLALGTLGYAIRTIDEFSFCQVPSEPIYDFEKDIPWCYKGTEMDLSNNTAYDSEIRHGITQLQYALPRLITEEILFEVSSHPEDVVPFFVLPVLVTTAELRVLGKDITLAKVEGTHILEDITQKVPYLILVSSFGPDFVGHAKRQFSELANIDDYQNVADIEKRLRTSGLNFYEFNLPSSIGQALAEGEHFRLDRFCSHFMVCSFDALPEVLNQVKQVIRSCLRKRKSFYVEASA